MPSAAVLAAPHPEPRLRGVADSTERLVCALSGEDDLDVLAGKPAELEKCRRRRDAERFLEPMHATRELGQEIGL